MDVLAEATRSAQSRGLSTLINVFTATTSGLSHAIGADTSVATNQVLAAIRANATGELARLQTFVDVLAVLAIISKLESSWAGTHVGSNEILALVCAESLLFSTFVDINTRR